MFAYFACLHYNNPKQTEVLHMEVLTHIEAGKIDTTPLIAQYYKLDEVIKVAVEPYNFRLKF